MTNSPLVPLALLPLPWPLPLLLRLRVWLPLLLDLLRDRAVLLRAMRAQLLAWALPAWAARAAWALRMAPALEVPGQPHPAQLREPMLASRCAGAVARAVSAQRSHAEHRCWPLAGACARLGP